MDSEERRLPPKGSTKLYLLASEGVSHVFAFLFIVTLYVWGVSYLEGFSFSGDRATMINTHMILMPMSSIYIAGTSMTLFRLFRGYETRKVKYLHAGLHLIGSLIDIVGLSMVYSTRHSTEDVNHFYSLHSWIGLIVVILMISQHVGALIFFTNLPISRNLPVRDEYATIHAFFGLSAFIAAGITSNIGLMEKAFHSVLTYATLDQSTITANFAGLFIACYCATIFYVCVNPYFEWDRIGED